MLKQQLLLFAAWAAAAAGFAVVGYAPEYRYGAIDWAAAAPHATHVILFSLEVGADGSLAALDRLPAPDVLSAARSATRASGARLLVCLGGNSRSGAFARVVVSAALRKALVASLERLLDANDLDGVDLNWEYPQGRDQWLGLFRLIAELKQSLAEKGRVLTMAFYPGQEQILSQAPTEVIEAVDLFLVMAYDARGQHSTFEFATSVVEAIGLRSKLPLSKVALGLPFYGRDVRTGEPKTYAEIVRDVHPLPDADQAGTMFWNGPKTIAAKTQLAMEVGCGGVMIWEIGQDVHPSDPVSLLRAVSSVAKPENFEQQQQQQKSEL